MKNADNKRYQTLSDLMQDLLQIKDELALQAHLMTMELNEQWQTLQHKAIQLETNIKHKLETLTEKAAKAEEHFFVGDENELKTLIDKFKDLKNQHHDPKK